MWLLRKYEADLRFEVLMPKLSTQSDPKHESIYLLPLFYPNLFQPLYCYSSTSIIPVLTLRFFFIENAFKRTNLFL